MDLKGAMKTALEFEEKGRDIYGQAAENSPDPLTQKTFNYLAEQEEKHINTIKEYIQSEDLHEDRLGASPEDVKTFFTMTVDEFRGHLKTGVDTKVYEAGLKLEKSSYDYYKQRFDEAEDASVRKFFHFMMAQENAHFILLQKSLEFLKDPDNFHAENEDWIFEG